jgi:hypothetical protein
MKRLFLVVTSLLALNAFAALAQGTINFNNRVPSAGLDARFYGGGGGLPGPYWLAQLYVDGSSVGSPVPFRTGAGAGYFSGGIVAVPGHGGGTTVAVEVRVWKCATSFEGACGGRGRSAPITVTLGGAGEPPSTPANLIGLSPDVPLDWPIEVILVSEPEDRLAAVGQSVTFRAESNCEQWPPMPAPGGTQRCRLPRFFTWQSSVDGVDWIDIQDSPEQPSMIDIEASQSTSALTIRSVSRSQPRLYRVSVKDGQGDCCCGPTSRFATLRVIDPPRVDFLGVSWAEGVMRLRVEAPPDLKVAIESSSDLRSWVQMPGVQPDLTGSVSVPLATDEAVRFFRVSFHQ